MKILSHETPSLPQRTGISDVQNLKGPISDSLRNVRNPLFVCWVIVTVEQLRLRQHLSAAARLLGLWFRILPGARISRECCQVEVSSSG